VASDFRLKNGQTYRNRPGPFGPARALLPKDQQPLVIDDDMPAYDAVERMVDSNFSQLPVQNGDGQIIGVFTWKSFSKRVLDLRSVKASIKPIELPVREAMEPARFIDPEVYIDTATNWEDIDYVLVGDERHLLGVLCVSNVFAILNDFAEAFVLLYEIEHEIRDLIHDVYSDEELTEVLDAMMVSATREAKQVTEELIQVLDEKGKIPAVGKAIRLLRSGPRPLERLEDFTFAQYRTLICSEDNWPRFAPVFATMRELVDADFAEVNELRNTVFHFRRSIKPKDTDRLRRFRDRLRYDRELFAKATRPNEEKGE